MKKRPQPDLYVKKRVGTKDKLKRRPNSKKSANVEWYARELIDHLDRLFAWGSSGGRGTLRFGIRSTRRSIPAMPF
jgi:hypothetical protein